MHSEKEHEMCLPADERSSELSEMCSAAEMIILFFLGQAEVKCLDCFS